VHGYDDKERELLEYGSLLHDIGIHISYERHHRHSYYLIKNGDLRGFDPQEIEVIALIARYHRQAEPKKSHEGYADLPGSRRKVVKTLSAMVRLAEGLDRSHAQALSGLDLYPRGDDYLARLRASGDAELELWAAHRHVAPLEKVLGLPLRFEVVGSGQGNGRQPGDGKTQPAEAADASQQRPRGSRKMAVTRNLQARN
jgi:exopolyphosphatase/guanosine-5'-triphosphate,3'-diphosphate pyrophosphatase